jgi:hypothetical protein
MNITGVNPGARVNLVVAPDANTPINAADVQIIAEGLANQVEYLSDKVRSIGGTLVFPFVSNFSNSIETWGHDANEWTQLDITTTPIGRIVAPIYLPNGCTITSVSVNVTAAGHAAAPANMPNIRILKHSAAGVGVVGQITDASAWPAYDTNHAITKSGLSEVVNVATHGYTVTLEGESGANSVALGLTANSVTVNFTVAP